MSVIRLLSVTGLHLILLPFTATVFFGLNLPSDLLAVALFVICHVVISIIFFRPLVTGAMLVVLFAILVGVTLPLTRVQLDAELNTRSYEMLDGLTVLITGPSDLGKAVARSFLERGATVILIGRSPFDKGTVTRHLEHQTRLYGYAVDLSHLLGLADIAELIMEIHPKIDIIVANAGIGGPLSDDPLQQLAPLGYEITACTNHLGHAFLIDQLMPALRKALDPRVILVSSRMHEIGTLEMSLSELTNWSHTYPFNALSLPAYSRSKLLNLLYARALAQHRPDITAVSLTPGTVATRGMPSQHLSFYATALHLPDPLAKLFTKLLVAAQLATWRRPDVAAQIYLYAALAPKAVVNGQYIDADMKVRLPETLLQPQTSDAWAEAVWQATEATFTLWKQY